MNEDLSPPFEMSIGHIDHFEGGADKYFNCRIRRNLFAIDDFKQLLIGGEDFGEPVEIEMRPPESPDALPTIVVVTDAWRALCAKDVQRRMPNGGLIKVRLREFTEDDLNDLIVGRWIVQAERASE